MLVIRYNSERCRLFPNTKFQAYIAPQRIVLVFFMKLCRYVLNCFSKSSVGRRELIHEMLALSSRWVLDSRKFMKVGGISEVSILSNRDANLNTQLIIHFCY